jgi:hypothetical protein
MKELGHKGNEQDLPTGSSMKDSEPKLEFRS